LDSPRQVNRKALAAAAVALLVILYGSLFPFSFHTTASPIRTLLASSEYRVGRIDFAANIIFYAPFGAALFLAFPHTRAASRLALIILAGFFISLSVEIAQTFDSGRFPSVYDVLANTLGGGVGGLLAWMYARRYARSNEPLALKFRSFVLILLLCWAGFWLFPYQLSFDPREYWHVLKRLVFYPGISYERLFQSAARWFVIATLLESITKSSHRRTVYVSFVALALFFRAWVGQDQLTNEHMLSAAAVVLLWCVYFWRCPWRMNLAAGLMAAAIALEALEPFEFSVTGRSFEWIPFTSFIVGSIGAAVYAMFAKLFAYGALLWTTMRLGWPWLRSVVASTLFVLTLRLVQVYLPGRSAEITDAVMVVGLGVLMRWLGEYQDNSSETGGVSGTPRIISPEKQ
jgi:VanZ family protein